MVCCCKKAAFGHFLCTIATIYVVVARPLPRVIAEINGGQSAIKCAKSKLRNFSAIDAAKIKNKTWSKLCFTLRCYISKTVLKVAFLFISLLNQNYKGWSLLNSDYLKNRHPRLA